MLSFFLNVLVLSLADGEWRSPSTREMGVAAGPVLVAVVPRECHCSADTQPPLVP